MRRTSKSAPVAASPFRVALGRAIDDHIRKCKVDGTVGIGTECLLSCVRPPSDGLDGAPRGTNCRYYYAQMFREVIQESPMRRNFVIDSGVNRGTLR